MSMNPTSKDDLTTALLQPATNDERNPKAGENGYGANGSTGADAADFDGTPRTAMLTIPSDGHADPSGTNSLRLNGDTRRNWWAFFALGTINNLGYVVVAGGYKSLAAHFNSLDLIGALAWASVGVGVFVRSLNAFALERTPFARRVLAATAMQVLGVGGVALCTVLPAETRAQQRAGFALLIGAILVVGASSSFGEAVLLGFLKNYPPALTGAWSSGTGMAGLFGAAVYAGLHAAKVSNTVIFFATVPTSALYLLAYFTWLAKPPDVGAGSGHHEYERVNNNDDGDDDEGELPQLERGDVGGQGRAATAATDLHAAGSVPGERLGARAWRCFLLTWRVGLQLAAVYFFEYVISVGFAALAEGPREYCHDSRDCAASKAAKIGGAAAWKCVEDTATSCTIGQANAAWCRRPHAHGGGNAGDGHPWVCRSDRFLVKNSFPVLAFAYQFGVIISRSSLKVVRVPKTRLWVLTAMQAANFAWWWAHDATLFMGAAAQVAAMVWVGFMGGLMYVNVFASLVDDPGIPDEDRVLCINLVAIWVNVGIVSSCVFDLVMNATFFPATSVVAGKGIGGHGRLLLAMWFAWQK